MSLFRDDYTDGVRRGLLVSRKNRSLPPIAVYDGIVRFAKEPS